MDTLSSISLLSPELSLHETVPFSADLETQHDTKITCLPFTTMPLCIPDLAKTLSPEQCIINDSVRVDPSSIRTNLVSLFLVSLERWK